MQCCAIVFTFSRNYRRSVKCQKGRQNQCNSMIIKQKLLGLVLLFGVSINVYAQRAVANNVGVSRIIEADLNRIEGPLNRSFNVCVGAGRANEGLRADWQRQLTLTHNECGFKYIRFHGLLTDDMGVYREDRSGKPMYNWQYIDQLFDFLLSIHMKPFVELSFMPNALASGDKTIFWWKGNVTPPKDYQKWDDLIRNLVQHWTERYGTDEVKSWYFEVWNEPNLKGAFFTGTQADYFKLYTETAKAVKSVSKDYRVGGPATAGNGWIAETINYCNQNNVPIDFISTHTYGVKQGFLDEAGQTGTVLSLDKNAVSGDMIRTRKVINQLAMPKLELHYTEWSASYTPSDPIHDSYHEASYILDKVKKAGPYVNSMSYWTFTDIFEEAGPRFTPFHGGFGLLNYEDIKKPAYYAFKFLNELADQQLTSADSNAIVTKNKAGNVRALFWDFTIAHPGDSINNQVYYRRDLPAKSLAPAKLMLKHLTAGTYRLNVYKVGYRANDAYTLYHDMHSPSQLTKGQVELLKKGSAGTPVSSQLIHINNSGNWKNEFPLRENDVYFVTLDKIGR